jgi:tetratricopeptide (TPR) repeat protein
MQQPLAKITPALLLLLVTSAALAGSRSETDSLKQVARTAKDTALADVYNKLSYHYRNSDPRKTLAYADSAIVQAKKAKYLVGVGDGYLNKGNYFRTTGDNAAAKSCYIWAYVQHKNAGNKQGLSSTLNGFASLHFLQGNLSVALSYFISSLKISEEIGDRKGIAVTLNNIGVINLEQKNFSKALEYFERAYHTFKELNDQNSMADALNNIGNIYHTQGIADEAIKYFEHALNVYTGIGNNKGKSTVMNNIGLVYFDREDYTQAIKYYHQSITLDEALDDKQAITIASNNMGNSYYYLQMYFTAKKYAERALALEKMQNDRIDMVNTYDLLHRIEDALGNYKTALEYYKLYKAYSDTLYSEDARQKLEDIEAQYQAEKAENDRLVRTMGRESVSDNGSSDVDREMKRTILTVAVVLVAFIGGMYVVFFIVKRRQ